MSDPFKNMKLWQQWVLWRVEKRQNAQGEWVDTKVPYSPHNLLPASSVERSHWSTYADAAAILATGAGNFNGVGFVFTAEDPFFFVDIDGALQPDGTWSPLALRICQQFAGAAIEVSQSGTGLHICGRTYKGFDHRNKPTTGERLELYTEKRFMAYTGSGAMGDDALDCSAQLQDYIKWAGFERTAAELAARSAEWTSEPCVEWRGTDDDEELIRRALKSGKNSAAERLGGAVSFKDLWEGNADVLAAKWPSQRDSFDRSEAEASLAGKLAFWTGKDCERMERLLRKSALVRDKWDHHPNYLELTITKACGFCSAVYQEPEKAPPPPPPPPLDPSLVPTGFRARSVNTYAFLTHDQLQLFAGCIYVASENKVLDERGRLLGQERFDILYGGGNFVLSADGKKTTLSAWEAFTKNHNYACPTVDKLCFRPSEPFAQIIDEGGYRMANFYYPPEIPSVAGDVSKFLDFLVRLLPVDRDRKILLHYMASCVQNVGRKFQWWPVIQGAQGNGKTLLLTIMTHAMGMKYCHLPNVHKMAKGNANFNGWIRHKTFLGLEEVYSAKRREFLDELKATVTNEFLPVEGKGVEEAVEDNRANGMAFTNHKNGVPISDGDRRWCIFFTAQQSHADIERDGLTNAYFNDLHAWVRGDGAYENQASGKAQIMHFLQTFPLEAEYDPAQLATRAPRTSSTDDAIENSRGMAEQLILETIEEGRVGFNGGFVSSYHLNTLLERNRLNVPFKQRRALMESIGYTVHPLLNNGRSPRAIEIDANTKPYIYLRNGHLALNFDMPSKVIEEYKRQQDVSSLNTAKMA